MTKSNCFRNDQDIERTFEKLSRPKQPLPMITIDRGEKLGPISIDRIVERLSVSNSVSTKKVRE